MECRLQKQGRVEEQHKNSRGRKAPVTKEFQLSLFILEKDDGKSHTSP